MIGRIVFAGTIGAVVGPLLVAPGTWVAQALGLDPNVGPWIIGLVFYSMATLVIFLLLRPEPMTIARQISDEEKRKNDSPDEIVRPIAQLLRIPAVQLAIFATLISQTVMVSLMVITPLHMSHHNHGEGAISFVISAHTLGMFGLSSVTGRMIDRYGRVPMMVLGAAILIASVIISPLSTTMPVLVVGLFLLGLGWNLGFLAGSSLLSDALRGEERTKMQGVNDMFVAFAAALGSFSSGPLFEAGGYIAVAGLGFTLTLLFLWLIRLLSSMQGRKAKPA